MRLYLCKHNINFKLCNFLLLSVISVRIIRHQKHIHSQWRNFWWEHYKIYAVNKNLCNHRHAWYCKWNPECYACMKRHWFSVDNQKISVQQHHNCRKYIRKRIQCTPSVYIFTVYSIVQSCKLWNQKKNDMQQEKNLNQYTYTFSFTLSVKFRQHIIYQ